MQKKIIVACMALSFVLSSALCAQMQNPLQQPPMPGAICADDEYVYQVMGKELLKLNVADMTPAASIELPKPEEDEAQAGQGMLRQLSETISPMRGPGMGPIPICIADDTVIVMLGKTLQAFAAEDLSTGASVDLPEPENDDAQEAAPGMFRRNDGEGMPMRSQGPPPASMCTDGNELFVLAGKALLTYSIPDLTLTGNIELPVPEAPEAVAVDGISE